jgi:hypothetical protein
LLDAASGRLILSLEPAAGPLGGRTQLVELLRQRVMAGFGAVFGPGFEPWEAQSVPPTYEAYQEMLAGSDAAWHFDSERALAHFRRAATLDSTYTGAKAGLASALSSSEDCVGTDSIARLLEPVYHALPPVDRGNLDYATAKCRGDLAGALEASRRVMEAAPRSVEFAILASITALELFRPREALAILQRLDSRRSQLKGQPLGMYWSFQAYAYHELGDYHRELQVAREASRGKPSVGESVALAALGQVGEVRQGMGAWLRQDPDLEGAECVALELRAHGHPEAAQEVFEQAAAWYRAHRQADAATDDYTPCIWYQLTASYYAGHWDEARAEYEHLAASDSVNVKARAALGALAARRGDLAEVTRMDQWLTSHRSLTSGSDPHRGGARGRATYARARLAALLGKREHAVALLRNAFDEGLIGRLFIHLDPDLESLRDYPPFVELFRLKD